MKMCYFYSIQAGGAEARRDGRITEDMESAAMDSGNLIVQNSRVIYFPDCPDLSGSPAGLLLHALLRTMPPEVRQAYDELAVGTVGAIPGPAVIRRAYNEEELASEFDIRLEGVEFAVDVRPAICHLLLFSNWPPVLEHERKLLAAIQWQVEYQSATAHFVDGVETLATLGLDGPPSTYFAGKEDERHARNADRILSELMGTPVSEDDD